MDIADDDIDIDKRVKDLLDRGLDRYGEGDLEGALAHWKHALILDPENEKATQYASYVEDNHDLAESGEDKSVKHAAELDYPFGLEEVGLAKLRDDQLEDDYESLVIESEKKKKLEDSVAAALEDVPSTSAEIDDGWDVDEGWVAELVEQTDGAFEAKEDEGTPSDSKDQSRDRPASSVPSIQAKVTAAAEEKADDTATPSTEAVGFDDFELGSPGGASEEGTSEESKSIELSQEEDDEEDDEEEDEGAYAAMEILAPAGDPGLEVSDAASTTDDDSEADFGALHASDESDFGDLSLDDSSDFELPESGMEFDESDPSEAPEADTKALAAVEKSIADIELGEVAESIGGTPGVDSNEPGEMEFLEDQPQDDAPGDQNDEDALAQIERDAPEGDSNERTTYIVQKLLLRGITQRDDGNLESASLAIAQALEKADDCAAAQKLIYAQEDDLVSVLMAGLGEASKVPELVVPLTEIPIDEIDNRAAFLLTRVDGNLSLEEILIVCGMPKLEALRHLSRMHSRSYLSLS